MGRILKLLILCIAALAAAWAIASLPGRVSAEIGPYTVETSEAVALTMLLLAFLVLYVLFRLISLAIYLPRAGSLWQRGRRRRAGDLAVTRALVALAAGEKADARRESGRARAYLGDTPQTLLLAAEAGRLSGRDDEASAALRALAARKDSAFLGLRGLLAGAVSREEWSEAAALARQAEAAHPGAAWLRNERAQLAIRAGDWAEALTLSGPGGSGPGGSGPGGSGPGGSGPSGARAALSVGAAQTAANPDQAERLARQALKADPGFTPGVLEYAGQLRLRGRERKALAVLTDGWQRAPHPDISALALAPVTDKFARMAAARTLTAGTPDHIETHLLLARVSLDAGLLPEARRHLETVRATGLDQRRVWLLLAELEEEQGGDTEAGRTAQRDALRRAARADPDPEWRCTSCHAPQPAWRAACPICLTPGGLAWGGAVGPGGMPGGMSVTAIG